MAPPLPYTVFSLGDAQLHQIHTPLGKLFLMGEVAVELFQETPTAFQAELRKGKFPKQQSSHSDVLATALELGLPVESAAGRGVTLLPSTTVEELLASKRRHDLIQPFKVGLLKLASQEAARLLAAGQYEQALPIAMDAVSQGEALFKPPPALQMFPLYLLTAQANLGLRRAKQCEDLLGMASWLSTKVPEQTTNVMLSQLNRLYGQLYALQGRHTQALDSFAQDVYCCSQEYGALDVCTSLGFYNLGKIFEAMGEPQKALSNYRFVARIWLNALVQVVLGHRAPDPATELERDDAGRAQLPLGTLQLMEVIDMLMDIARVCEAKGDAQDVLGRAKLSTAMAWAHIGEVDRARRLCEEAQLSGSEDGLFLEKLQAVQAVLEDKP